MKIVQCRIYTSICRVTWRFSLAATCALMVCNSGLSQPLTATFDRIAGPWFFDRPLESVERSQVAVQDAAELSLAINATVPMSLMQSAELLQSFVTERPASAWTPSLRANLAMLYYEEGQYSKALENWEHAWEQTKHYRSGPGKRIADSALANWTRLLVKLGRLDELQVIFAEAEGRRLDGGPLQQKFLRNREMYWMLRQSPSASYRCGWVVLSVLSEKVRGKYLDPKSAKELYKESNLFSGCSLKSLARVTRQEQWLMVGVERPDDAKDFPVPSVVHMKEGHYVGLLGEEAGLVLAYDPMSGLRHFRREVLNAETSGRFLVPVAKAPAGWRELSDEDLSSTVGRSGWYGGFLDGPENNCENCEQCPPGAGSGGKGSGGKGSGGAGSGDNGPGGSGAGPNSPCGGEICTAAGMAQWLVTEPNINLWLRDTPIICQPAYGPAVGLDLRYKQRDEFSGSQSDVSSFGPGWNSRWLSWVDNFYYARYGIMYQA